MKDKYNFSCIVEDIFKECKTMRDIRLIFLEMVNILSRLYNQNIELKALEYKERNDIK